MTPCEELIREEVDRFANGMTLEHLMFATRRMRELLAAKNRAKARRQVAEIRAFARNGISQSQLARQFYVSQSTISSIVRGKTWAH